MRPARTSAGGDGERNGERSGAAMDVMDRSGQDVEVEIGLDVATSTRARARFVARKPAQEPPKPPELGDPWCPLTVRARLQRMAEVFRRLPHTPDTKPGGYRSCMPEPVREIFKDLPGEPMRVPVGSADLKDATQVLDALIQMTTVQRILAWGIAAKVAATLAAKYLRCSDKTARTRMLQFLDATAADWNRREWVPNERDILLARQFIHRKV